MSVPSRGFAEGDFDRISVWPLAWMALTLVSIDNRSSMAVISTPTVPPAPCIPSSRDQSPVQPML